MNKLQDHMHKWPLLIILIITLHLVIETYVYKVYMSIMLCQSTDKHARTRISDE